MAKTRLTDLVKSKTATLEEVKRAVEDGAKLNHRDRYGNTALYYALMESKIEIANYLLDNGARKTVTKAKSNGRVTHEIDVVDTICLIRVEEEYKSYEEFKDTERQKAQVWKTFEEIVVKRGLYDAKRYAEENVHPIVFAITNGHAKIVEYFLNNGVSPNYRTPISQTLLMVAVRESRGDMVTLLLKNKADPNLKDWYGSDALAHACQSRDSYMLVKLLKDHGVVPDPSNPWHKKAL